MLHLQLFPSLSQGSDRERDVQSCEFRLRKDRCHRATGKNLRWGMLPYGVALYSPPDVLVERNILEITGGSPYHLQNL